MMDKEAQDTSQLLEDAGRTVTTYSAQAGNQEGGVFTRTTHASNTLWADDKSDLVWPRPFCRCVCPVFWSRYAHYSWVALDVAFMLRYICLALFKSRGDAESFEQHIDLSKGDLDIMRVTCWVVAVAFLLLIVMLEIARSMAFGNKTMRRMIQNMKEAENPSITFESDFLNKLHLDTLVIWVLALPCLFILDYVDDSTGSDLTFVKFLAPIFLGGWQAGVLLLVLLSVAKCSMKGVEIIYDKLQNARATYAADVEDGDSTSPANPANSEFWVQLLRAHRKMDQNLEEMVGQRAAALYVGLLAGTALFAFSNVVAYQAARSVFVRVVCVTETAVTSGYSMYAFLKPPADVTTLCCSKKHHAKSIHTAASQFFAWEGMTHEARVEHSIFMQYLDSIHAGFEIPLLGIISMESLLWNAKLLATAFPIMLAYVLHTQDD